jgi:hypothetical protein
MWIWIVGNTSETVTAELPKSCRYSRVLNAGTDATALTENQTWIVLVSKQLSREINQGACLHIYL